MVCQLPLSPLTRVLPLTKIRDIQHTKEETADSLSCLNQHQNCQPPSTITKDSVAASGGLVKQGSLRLLEVLS
jgi:hypothetical protein